MNLSQFFSGIAIVAFLGMSSVGFADNFGMVTGVILDDQGVPISGAQVVLIKTQDDKEVLLKEAKTHENGDFGFIGVEMGDYQVRIRSEGFTEDTYRIHVRAGGNPSNEIQLVRTGAVPAASLNGNEMLVEVKAKKRLLQNSSSVSSTEIQQDQIKKLPQGSEASLAKLVTSTTPGVVQGPFGQMFFRGSHSNVQYQIDGVQMPESPSNSFGPSFSPRNFERMEVITGGVPAEYGQRLAAVLNIVTKSGPEVPSGELELNYGSYNTVSPHLLYGGSNESGDLHYYVGLNYNRTDRGLDTPQPESYDDLSQGDRNPVHDQAHGDSEFAKVDWQVNNQNKVSFIAFHSYSFFQVPNYPSSFKPTDAYFGSGTQNPFDVAQNHQNHGEEHSHDHEDHHDHDHGHNHDHDHSSHGAPSGGGAPAPTQPQTGHDHSHEHNDHSHDHSGGNPNHGEHGHSHEHGHEHAGHHDDHEHDHHSNHSVNGIIQKHSSPSDGNTFTYVPTYTDVTQSERNAYVQTVWKHSFSERAFLQLAPYYKYSQVVVRNDLVNDLATSSGGATPITGAQPVSFSQNRHVNNVGLKGDYTLRPHEAHLMKTGFMAQGSRSDGVIMVQTDLNSPSFSDTVGGSGFFEGIYIQDDYTIMKSLVLNAGLRFDATQFNFDGVTTTESMLQPRLGLNFLATDTTKFHIFYGKLFQPASLENLRKTFNRIDPSPGAYDIKAQRDDYYEVGVAQQVFEQQVASVNFYYRDSKNVFDEAQLLRTSLAQPYNFAVGYAYGVEISLRGQLFQDWSQYTNYSYSIAKGKGISGGAWAGDQPDNPNYQFLDHVQLHTANAGLTYSKNNFWWTTQGVFGSGLRTGHDNDSSLPSHFTFDTTVGYDFRGKSWFSNFKLSGDVLNIFDNRYPVTIANAYNGSHYAAGRQLFFRLTKYL